MMHQSEQDIRLVLEQAGIVPVSLSLRREVTAEGGRPWGLYDLQVLIPQPLPITALSNESESR